MIDKKLLDWYKINQRILPWRESHNPYRIWLSEVMLQQTQVSTVIPYFNRFVSKYPTVQALAEAEEDDVLKLWEGLGYYSRARRLIPCAKMVVEVFDGVFPEDYHSIIKLPGIGSYTAGAILSIAYNLKYPAVDGNVMRVFSRLFKMENDISDAKSKKVFEEKVLETLPSDRRHFNQALMELGATICTPTSPKCDICPLRQECEAFKDQTVLTYPIKTKKIRKKTKKIIVCYIIHDCQVMIEKRPSEGLLAGLWGLPIYEETIDTLDRLLLEDYELKVTAKTYLRSNKHVFTHLIWEMELYQIEVDCKSFLEYPQNKWIDKEDFKKYALPTAFKKLIKETYET